MIFEELISLASKLIFIRFLASVDTTLDVNTMVGQYEHAVLSTIDLHAPLTVRMKPCRRKER